MWAFWKDLLERALTGAAAAVAGLQTGTNLPADWSTLLHAALGAAFWIVVGGLAAGKTGDPHSAGFTRPKVSQEAMLRAIREKLGK